MSTELPRRQATFTRADLEAAVLWLLEDPSRGHLHRDEDARIVRMLFDTAGGARVEYEVNVIREAERI